jgi:hypothetical protein
MEQFDNYCNEQLEMIEEGKLRNMVAAGALAANVAMGGTFVDDWSQHYQTSNDPAKEARATAVIEKGFNVPADAKQAIDTAVYIFAGDEGHTGDEFREYLEKTGAVESAYATKVQKGGGPARSYWQVEPKTAMDLVKNSSAYFGPKFHKIFGENSLKTLQRYNEQQMADALLKNNHLAASFAAAKWLASAW